MLSELRGQPHAVVEDLLRQEGYAKEQEFLSNNILHQGEYKNFKIVLYKHYIKPEAFWCVCGIDVKALHGNAQHTFLGCVEV